MLSEKQNDGLFVGYILFGGAAPCVSEIYIL